MKAYCVYDSASDDNCSTIVFAENPTQAKLIAQSTDACEDTRYIDIRVKRAPEADGLYKGNSEIDWYDDETSITLVRDLGWACWEPGFECDNCPAKRYCRWHEVDTKESYSGDGWDE